MPDGGVASGPAELLVGSDLARTLGPDALVEIAGELRTLTLATGDVLVAQGDAADELYVLLAVVEAGLGWLAVILVLNAALAAFYYLRVIVYMYMRDPESDPAPIDSSPFGSVGLALSVAGVLILGIFPGAILGLLEVSAASLF